MNCFTKYVLLHIINLFRLSFVFEILLHAYSGTMEGLAELISNIVILDTEVEQLYFNIKVAFDVAHLMNQDNDKKHDLLCMLTKAVDMKKKK